MIERAPAWVVRRTRMAAAGLVAAGAILTSAGCAVQGHSAARARWEDARPHERFDPEPAGRAEPAPASPDQDPAAPSNRDRAGTSIRDDAETALADSTLSLPRLLEIAYARNSGLRAAYARWSAALAQVPQASALPSPSVSYAYMIEPIETRVGPQRHRFGVSQTVPLFGKLGLRGEAAVHEANAAGARYEAELRDLRFRVTQLYAQMHRLDRAVHITRENTKLVARLENVVLRRYEAGSASHAALVQIQVERARLENQMATLEHRIAPLRAALNAELDRASSAPLASTVSWPRLAIAELPPDSLRARVGRTHPRIDALVHRIRKQVTTTRLAGRSYLPDLMLGAEYIETGEARMPGVSDSGKDAAAARAAIDIPLWFGRYRAEKQEAEASLAAARADRAALTHRLAAELEGAIFDHDDAVRRIELYERTLLPKARESLAVQEESFVTGDVALLELIDAQRTLLELELAHVDAELERVLQEARLQQLADPTGSGTSGARRQP